MIPECPDVQALLSDHADGRFPAGHPERVRIEVHLASCSDCAGVLADFVAIGEALRPAAVQVPDPGAFGRTLRGRLRPALPGAWVRPSLAAAAVLLLAVVGVLRIRQSPPALTPVSIAPSEVPSAWRLLGELPGTGDASPDLTERAEARDLQALIEEIRMARGGGDPAQIYREIASVQDFSRHGPVLREASYAP